MTEQPLVLFSRQHDSLTLSRFLAHGSESNHCIRFLCLLLGVPHTIVWVGLYGRLRRPQLHSVMPKRKLFGATLVLHAILGAIGFACACRSPPRTKPRCAGLVPKGSRFAGSLSLTLRGGPRSPSQHRALPIRPRPVKQKTPA